MKVLRITNSLDYGGIEKVFELHARYFKKVEYELVFVALAHGGATEDIIKGMGYPVIVLNVPTRIPSLLCIKKLHKLLRDERPDVVHTCGAEANFHGVIAAKLVGIRRVIAEEIGIPSHGLLARTLFRGIYLLADKVVAISNAVKDFLVHHEVGERKVVKIFNPVEEVRTSSPSVHNGDELVLVSVGRLEPIKNFKVLIDVIVMLQKSFTNRHIKLWLIGEGSQKALLRAYAVKNGVDHLLTLWGYNRNPSDILIKADVFLLPSLREGFGLACVEAIQAGLPVVVSNSGGMVEFIEDGVNGYLVDPRSAEEMVMKVKAFLTLSVEERMRMIMRAQKTVNRLFSPDRYLKELKLLYIGE